MAKNGNKTYILSISAIRLATKILQMPSIAKFIFLDYRKPPMYKKLPQTAYVQQKIIIAIK